MIEEFVEFVKENNVLGAAVAFIAGLATKSLVDSLVQDILMPIVGVLLPNDDWRQATLELGAAKIAIGSVISSLLNFLIIMFAVFIIVKAVGSRSSGLKKRK